MERLDAIAAESSLIASDAATPFSQAITTANAIKEIRAALTDEVIKEVILPLMNTKLGFRTDRDPSRPVWNKQECRMIAPEPYPLATVRECAIEAMLRGLVMVGNTWNIIAGNAYVTKEGFWFLIKNRIKGLTNFQVTVGVPKMVRPAGDARNAQDEEAKGALVPCSASWKMNGIADRIEREIPIRVNAMMGADAIIGKAERKILAAAHSQITGTALGDADATESEGELRDVTPSRATAAATSDEVEIIDPFAKKETPVQAEQRPVEPSETTLANEDLPWGDEPKDQPAKNTSSLI